MGVQHFVTICVCYSWEPALAPVLWYRSITCKTVNEYGTKQGTSTVRKLLYQIERFAVHRDPALEFSSRHIKRLFSNIFTYQNSYFFQPELNKYPVLIRFYLSVR
jgi:hypothetical protein